MIRIEVATYNGIPPALPVFAEFDETGGKIGRAEGNSLVLQDPSRTISRTHASINFRDGAYRIRNLGSAIPVYVNGASLGRGQDTPIADGDEVCIDGYTMKVLEKPARVSSEGEYSSSRKEFQSLLGSQDEANPFGDLLSPSLQPKSKKTPSGEATSDIQGGAPLIPSDFDPFWEPQQSRFDLAREDAANKPASADDLGLGSGPSIPSQNIDELFGLSSERSFGPSGPDSLLMPAPERSDKASADPLVALGITSRKKLSSEQPQRDDVPELHGSFRPPEARPDPAMHAVLPKEGQPPDVSSSEPYGMMLSWENKQSGQDSSGIKSVVVPSPEHDQWKGDKRKAASHAIPPPEEACKKTSSLGSVEARLPEVRSPDEAITEEANSRSEPRWAHEHDELLHAFLEGAGVPDLAVPGGLTPQFLNLTGQLLREATQGTLDLLLARTLTKREVRAELTMIAPTENNPLKFSPTVETALAHLLAPQGRGFMAPRQAMKDAQDDLRSHQFGFMAGMRAALAGVLERFSPEELERRLAQKTVIDSMLPFNRKAKLWDLFSERYKEISREAEEDFQVLFGREFLRAYQAQVAKLEQEKKK